LIQKLTRKNPRSLEKIFAITNKCTLAGEVTLDNKEANKDKKRKHDHFVTNVEQLRCNKTEYRP
jgi:hypothetical protein